MTVDLVPLKYVATVNDDKLDESTDPAYEFDYIDIGAVGRGRLVETPERISFQDAPSRARRKVRPGDTIVSTVRTYLRAVWAVEGKTEDLVVSTGFAVVRPRSIDARFLRWAVQSDTFVEAVVAASTGVSYPAINPGDLASLPIPVPPAQGDQRRIADFLDAETARIDALITAKQQMINILHARFGGLVVDMIFSQEGQWVRLGRIVDLLPGYAFDSSDMQRGTGMTRLLRGVNVDVGNIRWNDVVTIDPTVVPKRVQEQFTLRSGDLVIGMDRPLVRSGMRVAEITPEDAPALLVQRVARLRSADSDRSYIRHALSSTAFVRYFEPITTGVSVPHISGSQILDFRLPIPGASVRASIGAVLDDAKASTSRMVTTLKHQIKLLGERRQALITAAVIGKLEV